MQYNSITLFNGCFQLLVVSKKVATMVNKCTAAKQGTFVGDYIVEGKEACQVTILLRQRQLVIKQYYGPLNLLSSKVFASKVCPRLRLYPSPSNDRMIYLYNGAISQCSILLSSSESRDTLCSTYISFLHLNIGCSTEAFADKYRHFAAQIRKSFDASSRTDLKTVIYVDRNDILSSSFDQLFHLRQTEVCIFYV